MCSKKTNCVYFTLVLPFISKTTAFMHFMQLESALITKPYICFQSWASTQARSCFEPCTVVPLICLCFASEMCIYKHPQGQKHPNIWHPSCNSQRGFLLGCFAVSSGQEQCSRLTKLTESMLGIIIILFFLLSSTSCLWLTSFLKTLMKISISTIWVVSLHDGRSFAGIKDTF